MGDHFRNVAVASLGIVAASLGVWCGFGFRQPSMALLGFVAFLAIAGPLVLAIPVAACVESAKGVILILTLPIATFSATKLWFRITEKSDESIPALLVVFACAFLLGGGIACSLVASRADLRSGCSNADHGLGSFLSFTAAGAIMWLISRGNLVVQALWLALFFLLLGTIILLSRAFFRTQGQEQ